MHTLKCPLGFDCSFGPNGEMWSTINVNLDEAKKELDQHKLLHNMPQFSISNDHQMEEEEWKKFTEEWQTYKTNTNMTIPAVQHLEICLGDEVTAALTSRFGRTVVNQLTEEGLMTTVKEVFVKTHNWMETRQEMRNLKQKPGQTISDYKECLEQIAKKCNFVIKCSSSDCDRENDFSEQMVLDQMIHGLEDNNIQKQVLSFCFDNNNSNLIDIVEFAKTEETKKTNQIIGLTSSLDVDASISSSLLYSQPQGMQRNIVGPDINVAIKRARKEKAEPNLQICTVCGEANKTCKHFGGNESCNKCRMAFKRFVEQRSKYCGCNWEKCM